MITELLQKLLRGEHLTTDEAKQAMNLIMCGEVTPAQIGGFVIALRQKGETPEEVAGFVEAMRSLSLRIELDRTRETAVDGCGTGGDGANTFNISTAASLVVAAADIPVAKHGNRSVSSKCGSADLLAGLGADIDPGPEVVKENIERVGFGFLFAPRYHPAMRHAALPRRELGVRTIFNMLGPMTNPAGVKRQVIGVYSRQVM
ncbi:MAG TPA: anthranilate phosphoribosyltransferase, partial [candidate division Zixibacteria bacterium]|nr:anthranilate phosphoribosyltransferase [candidate division Zixibacteria bacterium]